MELLDSYVDSLDRLCFHNKVWLLLASLILRFLIAFVTCLKRELDFIKVYVFVCLIYRLNSENKPLIILFKTIGLSPIENILNSFVEFKFINPFILVGPAFHALYTFDR